MGFTHRLTRDLRAPRLLVACALWMASASVSTGQTPAPAPPQQPQGSTLNPTQEVAGQEAAGNALDVGPAKLRIGGYVGLTGIYRSTNSGGGPGTRFGSIPFADELEGNVSEFRLTAESSRLSIRVDADFPEENKRFRRLSGYFEMDFSGTAPGNVAVTSTSAGFRLRSAFAEAQYRDSFFMAAGQAFSLMTPAKDQLSMWPSDQQLSQAVDTNYLAGLTWGRFPQFRMTWRPSRNFNWAMSVENPEQQIGSDQIVLPSCCAEDISAQYNTGTEGSSTPNLMPDFLTRVALRPVKALHVDVGGVLRVFRHTLAPYSSDVTQVGGGASVNGIFDATPSTRLIVQSSFGSGMGRYIGGLVPDVAFHRDGSISPIGTTSWLTGVEQRLSARRSFAAYYSGVAIDNNFDRDVDGRYIGYGFPGSSSANNRKIQEVSGTFSTLTMKTENRGSAQIALQVSWLKREPWSQGSGTPSARSWLVFTQWRYNLP
ncbi:MAG: hypothetical protein C5B57_05620 [Blastocatellia bacterium]|nr:MAG: hypothetical protein C5B57_05620 [Blastocatellia bacterium]